VTHNAGSEALSPAPQTGTLGRWDEPKGDTLGMCLVIEDDPDLPGAYA
jgi:hypothetical protein